MPAGSGPSAFLKGAAMVILIGGSSHVGKTLLAQRLLERLKYPYISLDHLKMGFIRSGMTELTVYDDPELTVFMWPFVTGVIKTAVENGQNLIIEGCYVPSDWRESFEPEYLEHIRSVFLVMSEGYLRGSFDKVTGFADVIERRLCDEADPERLIRCSARFKAECIEQGVPYIEITDAYDIERITQMALEITEAEAWKTLTTSTRSRTFRKKRRWKKLRG